MADKYRLLIVEDHQKLAENIYEYLGEENYELDYAANGLTALHLLATNSYDLIILDVMLPGVDGLTICQRLRQDLKSSVPVIMLTALGTIEDKAKAFMNEADDYLVKPFHMRELELRIQALCRRNKQGKDVFEAENIQYYPGTLSVFLNNENELVLSGYSATIFEALIKNYPRFIGYEEIGKLLWEADEVNRKTIRTHVYILRKVLKEHFSHELIKTLHGRGYALSPF